MRQLILILILINLLTFSIIFDWLSSKKLVAFLSIGQGNAVLFKDKNNIFLYDTGKYPSLVLKELDRLLPFYQRKIDVLIISHPDKDHYFASLEILKRYRVRTIILNGFNSTETQYQELLSLARNKQIPIVYVKRGATIIDNHFVFYVLNPSKKFKKDNDNSIVLKAIGKNSYLLTGDIEKEAIKDLINCCSRYLLADFFLVPHHGSRYSLDEDFYFLVKPKVAVIQTGSNFYGHPHKETLTALVKYAKKTWRTDFEQTLIANED